MEKLRLARETVRCLTEEDAAFAAGGRRRLYDLYTIGCHTTGITVCSVNLCAPSEAPLYCTS